MVLSLEREAPSPISVPLLRLARNPDWLSISHSLSVGVDVFRCYERNCYSSTLRWLILAIVALVSYKVHVYGFLPFVYVSRPPRYPTGDATNNEVSLVVAYFHEEHTAIHYTKDLFDAIYLYCRNPQVS